MIPKLVLLACLASMMHGEARGEGEAGMLAVAEVAIVRSHETGQDLCRVVSAPGQFAGYDPRYVPTLSEIDLARRAVAGEGPDVHGADLFAEKRIHVNWKADRVLVLGNHAFYRRRQ